MPVTVEEVVHQETPTTATSHTIDLASTPQGVGAGNPIGDVIVILTRNHKATSIGVVTGITGAGATWSLLTSPAGDGRQQAWIGINPTTAGTITVSRGESALASMTLLLIRGLTSTNLSEVGWANANTGSLTPVSGLAAAGQIRIGVMSGFDATFGTFDYTSAAPASGWVEQTEVDAATYGIGSMYRIPTESIATLHTINLDSTVTGDTISHCAFTLGTATVPTAKIESVYAEYPDPGIKQARVASVYAEYPEPSPNTPALISVVDYTIGTPTDGSANPVTATLATAPQPGDIVYVIFASHRSIARNATGCSGLGGTWIPQTPMSSLCIFKSLDATASGVVTVSQSSVGVASLVILLVRGLAAHWLGTFGTGTGGIGTTGNMTASAMHAAQGQIYVAHWSTVGGGGASSYVAPFGTPSPAAGWVTPAYASNGADSVGAAWRVPTETDLTSHTISMDFDPFGTNRGIRPIILGAPSGAVPAPPASEFAGWGIPRI